MKKTFQELAQQIESLQEDQQGKLQGGFASLGLNSDGSLYQTDNCTNNCQCTNTVAGCGSSTNGWPACSN